MGDVEIIMMHTKAQIAAHKNTILISKEGTNQSLKFDPIQKLECTTMTLVTPVNHISSHCPLGDLGVILKMYFAILFYWMVSSDLLITDKMNAMGPYWW